MSEVNYAADTGAKHDAIRGEPGKSVAEAIDPTYEYAYWRGSFAQRPYIDSAATFDDYGPAYQYGVTSFIKYREHAFEDIEFEMALQWGKARGKSALRWEHARLAARDAWDRVRKTK